MDGGYRANLRGLYAVGEACGGIHGACRSAGNAGSQAVLSGLLCAQAIAGDERGPAPKACQVTWREERKIYDLYVPRAQAITLQAMGIYRRGEMLQQAKGALEDMLARQELQEDDRARQMVKAMCLMITAALRHKESRGTHMRLDYPAQDPALCFGMEL